MPRVFIFAVLFFVGCSQSGEELETEKESRIISLKSSVTEMLFALNVSDQLVGRDVSSVYPEEANRIQNVGSAHSVALEALLSFSPTKLFSEKGKYSDHLIAGLRSAGVVVIEIEKPTSIESAQELLQLLGEEFNKQAESKALMEKYDCAGSQGERSKKKALFVYSRGGGNLLIAGGNTGVSKTIELAGAVNVAWEIDGFKPLTSESLVKMNPEVIIMFDHGYAASQEGALIWDYPGMTQVKAGVDSALLHFPSHQLSSFGLTICDDLATINQALKRTTE